MRLDVPAYLSVSHSLQNAGKRTKSAELRASCVVHVVHVVVDVRGIGRAVPVALRLCEPHTFVLYATGTGYRYRRALSSFRMFVFVMYSIFVPTSDNAIAIPA